MQWQLLWYVLAGFILGFALSTLWEWLYFRVRRVAWRAVEIERLETQLQHYEAQLQQLQTQPPSAAAYSDDAAAAAPSAVTPFLEPASPWQSELSANRASAAPPAYQSPGVFLDSETAESLHEETHYDAAGSAAGWDTEVPSTRHGVPSAEQPLPPTSLQTDAEAMSTGLPPAGRPLSEYERFDEADDVAFTDERSAEPQVEQTDEAELSLADAAPVPAPDTSDVEFVEPEADAPPAERVAAEAEDEAANAAELGIADAETLPASGTSHVELVEPEADASSAERVAAEPADQAADAANLGSADAPTGAASDTADAVSSTPEAHAPRVDADLGDAARATSVVIEAAPEPFAEDESTADPYAAPMEELPSDRIEEPPAEAGYVASVVDDTDFAAARNAEHEDPPVEAEFTPLAAEPPAQTSDPAFTVIDEGTGPSAAEYAGEDADDVGEYRHVDRADTAPGRLAAGADTQDQTDTVDAPAWTASSAAEGEYRTDTAATTPGEADVDRDASLAGLDAPEGPMSAEGAVDTISDAIAAVAAQEYAAATLQAAEHGAAQVAEPTAAAAGQAPDNLALIKGIGSKYRQRLYTAGIYTFHQLHLTDAAILAEITGAFASAKPESWRAQAGDLAAEYDRTAAQYDGPPPDDFAEIRGLSPEWAQRLYLVGICSYADLAARSRDDLHALLPDLAEERQFEPAKWTARAAALAQRKAEEEA